MKKMLLPLVVSVSMLSVVASDSQRSLLWSGAKFAGGAVAFFAVASCLAQPVGRCLPNEVFPPALALDQLANIHFLQGEAYFPPLGRNVTQRVFITAGEFLPVGWSLVTEQPELTDDFNKTVYQWKGLKSVAILASILLGLDYFRSVYTADTFVPQSAFKMGMAAAAVSMGLASHLVLNSQEELRYQVAKTHVLTFAFQQGMRLAQ